LRPRAETLQALQRLRQPLGPLLRKGLAGVALAVAGAATLALPEDRNQAIEITADRAVRDERAGYTVYSGDVVLYQGSLKIEARRLTIFHDREAADSIVAEGSPARMQQQPAADQELVTASASKIVYVKSREQVLLSGGASIEQAGAVVTGDSIEYMMAEQRVRADAQAGDGASRVQVLIPAEVVESQQQPEAGPPVPPVNESGSDGEAGLGDPGSP
jgi:lipopolysaccharide export system protein LptA